MCPCTTRPSHGADPLKYPPDSDLRILKDFPIDVPDRRIYHRLGYKSGTQGITDNIRKIVEEEKQRFQDLIRPAALYKILDHTDTNRHPIFAGANKVALCVCTVGPEIERTSQTLTQEGEMLRGFILDSLGSESAEEAARFSDEAISTEARRMDLWPSKRFSPGYGIWDIREQAWIFELLPTDQIGVELTEDFLMLPRKSVSFRINLYDEREHSRKPF